MERRTLAAFLLIIIFFIIWAQFAPERDLQPVDREEVRREEIALDPDKPREPAQEIDPLDRRHPPLDQAHLRQTKLNNYYITYSTQGGYIQAIAFNKPENRLPFKNIGFQPATGNLDYEVRIRRETISFYHEAAPDKKFTFGENLIEIQGISNSSILLFSFSLDSGVSRIDQRYFEVFHYQEGSFHRTHPRKVEQKALSRVKFAGARSKYYAASLLKGNYNIEWEKLEKTSNLFLSGPPQAVSLYVGPQTMSKLEPYGLEEIAYYGFWHFLAVGLIRILYFFHGFLNNWGLSIVFLSFFAYAVLFPFTAKSSKAMKKMQEIQPLMQELKEKYKDKPQKMQKETVELYKKHKVNPLGGCLPLLFQFPIIIAFYQVVFRFPQLKGASFLWIKDLALPDRLFNLPFSILGVEHFNLLPILVMTVGIIQQHVVASSSNPQQKKMGLFMGVFMGIIFYNFPSALVLYWLIQNLLTLAYQIRLKKARTTA